MSSKAKREAHGEWLIEAGKADKDIVVVDADLAESTKTISFAKVFLDRFFDVGAAEQNLVDVAAGLSLGGKKVFASSFAYFLTGRAWDQVRNIVPTTTSTWSSSRATEASALPLMAPPT